MKYRIMKKGITICLFLLVTGVQFIANAQKKETDQAEQKQIDSARQIQSSKDSLNLAQETPRIATGKDSIILSTKKEFNPNPKKALIYSAVFPGLGQAYNRKYWKLPIVYGGFFGVVYGISWNGRYYKDYSRAYKELVLDTGNSWTRFTPYSYYEIKQDESKRRQLEGRLKRQKDNFRQNRDLAIIVGVGLYALCIIDAYVDAQLYHFDISPDLSMNIVPVIYGPSAYSKYSIGLQCNITF